MKYTIKDFAEGTENNRGKVFLFNPPKLPQQVNHFMSCWYAFSVPKPFGIYQLIIFHMVHQLPISISKMCDKTGIVAIEQ